MLSFDGINNGQSRFCGAKGLQNLGGLFKKTYKNTNVISGTWFLNGLKQVRRCVAYTSALCSLNINMAITFPATLPDNCEEQMISRRAFWQEKFVYINDKLRTKHKFGL